MTNDEINAKFIKGEVWITTEQARIENYPHYQKLSIRSIWVNGSPYADRSYLSCNSTDSVAIVFVKLVKRGYSLKFVQ